MQPQMVMQQKHSHNSRLPQQIERLETFELYFPLNHTSNHQGNRIKIMSSHWLQKWLFRQ